MKILLVEDETKLALSLKKSLESEGYLVTLAQDGKNGLFYGYDETFDLILLDLGLPKLDGLEICRKLREDGVKTPVLILTARDSSQNKVAGLDSGADDYVVKPFEFEEVLARIRALLRRGKNDSEPTLSVDSLNLDPSSKKAERGKQELFLSSKEYSLLEYLMRNKGRVLSKQQIREHVWEESIDPFTNVVEVYIGYLRAKIDKKFPGEKKLIKTVKGLGYKIG